MNNCGVMFSCGYKGDKKAKRHRYRLGSPTVPPLNYRVFYTPKRFAMGAFTLLWVLYRTLLDGQI